ncbi:hypothetical protein N7508_000647 [Penicillium antarcticum]|uniref:uncharacterized protein n=1 Tax=Penicillium antarcticum TaxID=416450 RepID=UPI0023986C96|nr:uncharacterized protein N7508_000647 [Penicillium antarcticum]KAJ5320364.1 hypothetical protein N7508_000647 [Penicillium antarcticum]
MPLTGLCKQYKIEEKLEETVSRLIDIDRWNAGGRQCTLQAVMALPDSNDDGSVEEYESEDETEPEIESGSNTDTNASDADEPRQSQDLTHSNPGGKFHRWFNWINKADLYPTKKPSAYNPASTSTISTLNNKAKTGKMTKWPLFKAPILWKDEHNKFGLRPLVLARKHGLNEKEKKPRRRIICAGPAGLQPLVLVEKHKKRWGWPSWDSFGHEKVDEMSKSNPLPRPSVQAESRKTVILRSRLPVPGGRTGGQPVAVGVKKRPLLARRTTSDRVTF